MALRTPPAAHLNELAARWRRQRNPHDRERLAQAALTVAYRYCCQAARRAGVSRLIDIDDLAACCVLEAVGRYRVGGRARPSFLKLLWQLCQWRAQDWRRNYYGRNGQRPLLMPISTLSTEQTRTVLEIEAPDSGAAEARLQLADVLGLDWKPQHRQVLELLLRHQGRQQAVADEMNLSASRIWLIVQEIRKKVRILCPTTSRSSTPQT